MSSELSDIATQVIERAVAGSAEASDELLSLTYKELRGLAGRLMRNEPMGHTLQPTALVHEAYLRLVSDNPISWNGKGHDIEDDFRAVADEHWDPLEYINWRSTVKAIRNNSFTHALPCSSYAEAYAQTKSFGDCSNKEGFALV